MSETVGNTSNKLHFGLFTVYLSFKKHTLLWLATGYGHKPGRETEAEDIAILPHYIQNPFEAQVRVVIPLNTIPTLGTSPSVFEQMPAVRRRG